VLGPLQSVSHRTEISAYGTVVELGEITDLRNTLANANAQLAKANAALAVAHPDFERVKGLFDANQNVSQKSVQAAEGAWRTEESNVQAAQAAVDAAQATAQQRWGNVVAGWVSRGGADLERLRQQNEFLVQVTLSPSQSAMTVPPEGSVQSPAGRLLAAKLVSPTPRTDPKIQGRSFFYLAPAETADLLPGMNIVMLLPIGEPVPGVVVPSSSVVWLQGKPWVYAQPKPDHFVRREISTDQPVKDGWVQPADFAKDEQVVVQGPQVLLSEEFRAQITVGD
jgi:multidrug efflux pump subunit AcrA (membrane-fusion protein)